MNQLFFFMIYIIGFNTRQNLIESRQPGQATDLTDQTDKNGCFSKYFVKKSVKTR